VKESLISSVPLFAALSDQERVLLTSRMSRRHHSKGDMLFVQGEASDALYLIESGWVRLRAEGFDTLASMGPGGLVGEMDMLSGSPRSTSAQATADTECWVLLCSDLEEVVAEHPGLGVRMSCSLGCRVAALGSYLVQRLRDIPGLQELDEEILSAVAQRLEPQEVRRGTFIFEADEPGEALYVLENGEVRLLAETVAPDVNYIELSEGAVFGEMPLLSGKMHAQAARAASDVLLWALSKDDFDELCADYPIIRHALSRELRAQLGPEDRELAVQRLRVMPLFADLAEETLQAIARRLLLRHVPAGEPAWDPVVSSVRWPC
jgi:CRP-like cAMP-binding protein